VRRDVRRRTRAGGHAGYYGTELATYKCPRTVDLVGELRREPNGKLYKRRLREHYWAGHESLVI
jgi:long-chain acyl-CoA synthetase